MPKEISSIHEIPKGSLNFLFFKFPQAVLWLAEHRNESHMTILEGSRRNADEIAVAGMITRTKKRIVVFANGSSSLNIASKDSSELLKYLGQLPNPESTKIELDGYN